MRVDLIRYNSTDDYTDGMILIDGVFQCYTMEDEKRTKKVYGETRIENGVYDIVLRNQGRFHINYAKKFDFHIGMLCITNAPDYKLICKNMEFQYILIHIGNDDDDTAGCPLVGTQANSDKNVISHSTVAYKKIYPIIAQALLKGERVKINVTSLTPDV